MSHDIVFPVIVTVQTDTTRTNGGLCELHITIHKKREVGILKELGGYLTAVNLLQYWVITEVEKRYVIAVMVSCIENLP
jgi:hypothetical protein